MKKKTSLILLYLFCCVLKLYAQAYTYTHYTTREGLAGETVYTTIQDHDGFLWFGTETGLSRFDGKNFKNFTIADGLVSDEVFGFYEDALDRLWILAFSKEICYYRNGKIYNKHNDPFLRTISFTTNIKGISGTKDDRIIIWDENNNTIVIDRDNHVRKYNPGTFQIDYKLLKDHNFLNVSLLRLPPALENLVLKNLSPHKKGNNFIKKNDEIGLFSSGNKMHSRFIILYDSTGTSHWIETMNIDFQSFMEDGNLIGRHSHGGAYLYDILKHRIINSFLPDAIINGIYEDREKNLWFNTKGDGIFKLSRPRMLHYAPDEQKHLRVQFIVSHSDHIYLGADNGHFWELNSTPGTAHNGIPFLRKRRISTDVEWLNKNIPYQFIYYAHYKFIHIAELPYLVPKSLYFFKDTLLLATSTGAILYHTHYLDTLYAARTTAAIEHNDRYYIGTLYGLLVMNKQKNIISKPLPYRISYFVPDKGTIWVATYDKGIFQLRNDTIIRSINMGNSMLSSNLCRCIYVDGPYLWVGTDKGLHKIRLSDTKATVEAIYNADNGLNSNIVNAVLVRDSIVYVGTVKGLNVFNKNDVLVSPMLNLKFTGLYVADTAIGLEEEPVLPHKNNNIKFEFSAISFSLDKISYRYRILGLDTNWKITPGPLVNLIALPSGNYTLQVQAIHPLGYKSVLIEKKFRVEKAIFEYWWFWLAVLTFCSCILFYLLRNRIRTIHKKEAEKSSINRKMVELEQMALRAQMNPHFIFNCLNSIQNYILKQDAVGANFYLSRFAALVRKTLEHAPKIYISLREEINYLTHYIELEYLQVNHPYAYTYSITIDPRIAPDSVLFPNMILQPFVENAIKHGLSDKKENGCLKVDFMLSEQNMLVCTIEDNGPGIEATVTGHSNTEHHSRGISLSYKRIEMLNLIESASEKICLTLIDLHKEGAEGTRVMVSLPLKIYESEQS